jgi:hypothetical protein
MGFGDQKLFWFKFNEDGHYSQKLLTACPVFAKVLFAVDLAGLLLYSPLNL